MVGCLEARLFTSTTFITLTRSAADPLCPLQAQEDMTRLNVITDIIGWLKMDHQE